MRIGALVLAAGESSRLGTPKQLLLDASGRPLVSVVVHALHAAGCEPIVVVLGAHAEGVAAALIADATTVHLVPNRAWSEGMGSSIRTGIAAMSTHAMMQDLDAVLVAACDMPTADGRHFTALRDAFLAGASRGETPSGATPSGPTVRVASEYAAQDGKRTTRGIPAVLPRSDWPQLLTLAGDRGAKALLETGGTLTVPLAHGSFDLDTPADVAAWRAQTAVVAAAHEAAS